MYKRTHPMTRSSGFTLIEALVALAVFSFGVLAIAKFQANIVADSTYSKARSEAVQLAQKKIDELRSYATEPQFVAMLMDATMDTADKFPGDVTADTYPDPAEPLTGNNADFARTWDVACDGSICRIVVNVTWTDVVMGFQTVSLETEITWRDPRGLADLEDNNKPPAVPSATGRAYLGDGTVSEAQYNSDDANDNLDGTTTIEKINNGDDVVLVDNTANDDGSHDIILTLEDACVSGDCIDFVEISGRVYIDNIVDPDNVYVLASDAAYCARTISDPVATTSPDGDYKYFPYTCYLGGGWHGNIGILVGGNVAENRRRVCVGDPSSPNSDDGNGDNNWRQMELASRRVYRGMTVNSSVVTIDDTTLFYSQGIKDQTHLPDPDWAARNYGHDFVITTITGAQIDGDDCYDALTHDDADVNNNGVPDAGDLFYGVSTDFVCLNKDNNPTGSDYLDTIDAGYRDPGYCPYDPSRGPAIANFVSGTVTVTGDVIGSSYMATSASADNCWFYETIDGVHVPIDASAMSSAPYECIVYSWDEVGWSGRVYITPDNTLACTPTGRDYTALTGDPSGQDYSCAPKLTPTISGTLIAYMNDMSVLSPSSVEAVRNNADSTTTTTPCTVVTDTDSDGNGITTDDAYFECNVAEESLGSGWLGTVTVTQPDGVVCDTTTGTGTNWDSNSPLLTKEWVTGSPLTSETVDLSTYCTGPQTTLRISGIMTHVTSLTGATLPTVMADGSACSTNDGSDPVFVNADGDVEYHCDVDFDYKNGWSGSIVISDPLDATLTCSGDLSWSPGSALYTNGDSTAVVQCGTTDTVSVEGSLTIVWPHGATYCGENFTDIRCGETWPFTTATEVTIAMVGSGADPDGTCEPVSGDPDAPEFTGAQVGNEVFYSGATDATPKNITVNFSCTAKISWNQKWTGDITYTVSPATNFWAGSTSSGLSNIPPGQPTPETVSATLDAVP